MKKHIMYIIAVCCLLVVFFLAMPRMHTVEIDVVGNWVAQSGGFDDKISFLINENGEHVYQSWLHDRPSESGTWNLVDTKLTIVTSSGSIVFEPVYREDEKLVFKSLTAGISDGTYVILK